MSCTNYGYGSIPTTVTADCDFTGVPITTIGTEYDARSISASSGNVDVLSTVMTVISGPVISGIAPVLQATSTFQLTVSGASMPVHPFSGDPDRDVRLIRSGQSDIVCTSVSGGSSVPIIVSCPASAADITGPYDVKVTDENALSDTLSAALQFFTPWSSPVQGGGFSPSGSDYGIFAHDGVPYFTVQAFDEVEKVWGSSSGLPTTIPSAAGKDAAFSSTKVRAVVSTASATPALWAYEFTPATGIIGSQSNPASGAVGMDVNAIDIASNDNVLAVATSGGDYFYVYDIDVGAVIGSFWTSTLSNVQTKPTGTCNDIDFHPNLTYIAVACDSAPYLFVYNFDNATPALGSKLSGPTAIGPAKSVEFSPDGTHIAVATDTSPYVQVFPFSGGTISAAVTAPNTPPTGAATGVSWPLYDTVTGPTNLGVSHAIAPYITVYNFNTQTGTFVNKLVDPTPALGSTANTIGFHPHGDVIFVGQDSSPYVTSYNFTSTSDDDYRVYRYMANFDTSYLPTDAQIIAATLSIYIDSVNVGTDWQLIVQDGTPSTEPLVVGDYDYNNYSTQVSTSGLTASTMTAGAYNDIPLNVFSGIKPDGISQFILRHEEDIGNSAPAQVETVDIEVGSSVTFPGTACTTSATFTALYADSDYNLCNSVNVPKLSLTYSSASSGSPGITTVNWTNAQEAALAPTDGLYTIEAFAKGPVIGLRNGTVESTGFNRTLVDIVDNWDFWKSVAPSKPFPYTKHLKYDVDGINQIWYELEDPPSYYMPDRSGKANHSTSMSFPIADNITITVDSSESAGAALIPDVSGIANPSLLGDIESFGLNAEGDPRYAFGDMPSSPAWMNIFNRASLSMGLEKGVLVGVMVLFVSVILGLGAYIATGNPMLTIVGCAIALMAGVTLGVFPVYYLIMFVVIGVATVGISRSV